MTASDMTWTPAEAQQIARVSAQAQQDARHTKVMLMVFSAAAAGIAIGWLLRRLFSSATAMGGPSGGHTTNVWVNGGGFATAADGLRGPDPSALPAPAQPVVSSLPRSDSGTTINHRTILQSSVLNRATMLCQAPPDRTYVAHVRAVAPPGAFVMVADNPGRLTGVVGDGTFVIPVGESHEIRLRPNQQLYARGSTSGAIVSYSLAPELL